MSFSSIDLFAGCGGLSLGLSQAGFGHLFAIEGHKDPFSTYKKNLIDGASYSERWPKWLPQEAHDIRHVLAKYRDRLEGLRGTVDLVAGGPPCQGFSMNGRRDPADPRSAMIGSYFDFVELVKPRLVLLENVRGFASMPHVEGGYFPDFAKRRLSELGYDAFDCVVSSADWGVPQRRPRYILIAYRTGAHSGVDPIERLKVKRRGFLEKLGLWPGPTPVRDALLDLEVGTGETLFPDPEFGSLGFKAIKYQSPTTVTPYLRIVRDGYEGSPSDLRLAQHTVEVATRMREVLETCPRGQSISPQHRQRLGIKKRSTTPLDPNAPSPTITTLPDDLIHYSEPRTMTVREHARIQSFPDWFSFAGRYTTGGARRKVDCPRYTQVGNAVPPLLARAIGETLLSLINDEKAMKFSDRPEITEEISSMSREVVNGHIDLARVT